MLKKFIFSLIVIVFCFCSICFAESIEDEEPILVPSTFTFIWDITTAEDDAERYAIFRSREHSNWAALNYQQIAFAMGLFKDSQRQVTCVEDGVWYWVLRAVDSAGNVSDISNVVVTLVDAEPPAAAPNHFEIEVMDMSTD